MNLIIPNGFEANFTVGFARGLAANGVRCLVASCPETHERLQAAGISCVQVFDAPTAQWRAVRKTFALLRYYTRLIRLLLQHRGAVIHFCGMFRNSRVVLEGPLVGLVFRLLGLRYLYTVHNVLPHGKEGSGFFKAIYRFVYRLPHTLIVHTAAARRQLIERFGVSPGRIVLSSIGLNEEMPDTELTVQQARLRLDLTPNEDAILFFGKIEPYKGLDILIDAISLVSNSKARLVVAGVFSSLAYRQEIHSRIEQSPRVTHIRLHEGHVPNDQGEVYFKACDVLCLPYRNIYQSGLLFLAPRFGLPMVTTDVGSLRQFVEPAMGVVAQTNDAAGLAAALDKFFGERTRFSREAILAHAQQYRWDVVCRELSPLYDQT